MLGLEGFIADYGGTALAVAVAALAAGGFAKGVVGFALPLIALSLAGSFLPYDVAVAVRALQADGAVGRVLVFDCDVHQGDGTAAFFAGEPGVFTCSIHCDANYPHVKGLSDLDIGLAPGTSDDAYLAVVRDNFESLLARVKPDLVFYNAGVDPHAEDLLGRLAPARAEERA